jgi:hypothetical protein
MRSVQIALSGEDGIHFSPVLREEATTVISIEGPSRDLPRCDQHGQFELTGSGISLLGTQCLCGASVCWLCSSLSLDYGVHASVMPETSVEPVHTRFCLVLICGGSDSRFSQMVSEDWQRKMFRVLVMNECGIGAPSNACHSSRGELRLQFYLPINEREFEALPHLDCRSAAVVAAQETCGRTPHSASICSSRLCADGWPSGSRNTLSRSALSAGQISKSCARGSSVLMQTTTGVLLICSTIKSSPSAGIGSSAQSSVLRLSQSMI